MENVIKINSERLYGCQVAFSFGEFAIKATGDWNKITWELRSALQVAMNEQKDKVQPPWIVRIWADSHVQVVAIDEKRALMIQPGCCKFHLLEKNEGSVSGKNLNLEIYSSDFVSASIADGALVVEFNEYRHGDQCTTVRAEIVKEKRFYDLITLKVLATERKLMQKMIVEIGGKKSEVTRDEFK